MRGTHTHRQHRWKRTPPFAHAAGGWGLWAWHQLWVCMHLPHHDSDSDPTVRPGCDESPVPRTGLEWLNSSLCQLDFPEWNELLLDTIQGRNGLRLSLSGRIKFSPLPCILREVSLSRSENWVSQCWTAGAQVFGVVLAFCFTEPQSVIGEEHLMIQGSANYNPQATSSLWLTWFLPFWRLVKTQRVCDQDHMWAPKPEIFTLWSFYRKSLLTLNPMPSFHKWGKWPAWSQLMLKLRLDSKFLNFHISFLSTVTQLPLLFWKIGTATLFREVFQCPCSSTLLGVPFVFSIKRCLKFPEFKWHEWLLCMGPWSLYYFITCSFIKWCRNSFSVPETILIQ